VRTHRCVLSATQSGDRIQLTSTSSTRADERRPLAPPSRILIAESEGGAMEAKTPVVLVVLVDTTRLRWLVASLGKTAL